jgi:hypothetical protein
MTSCLHGWVMLRPVKPSRRAAVTRSPTPSLAVEHLDPVSAIRTLAEVTFDHHESHPDFIRLVSTENIHRAEHIAKSQALTNLTNPAIDLIAMVLEAGREQGVFTSDIDAVDLHMLISSFCFFRVANRHTFGTLFGRDLTDPARRDHYRRMLGDIVVGHLTSPGGADAGAGTTATEG